MSEPIRVLELRSVRGTGGGPEKTILQGAARADRSRFVVTVCYLRDARDEIFGIDRAAAGLPIDYVEVREKHSLDLSVVTALRNIVRERRIDIVHAHEYKTDLLAWVLGRLERVIPLATVHGWTGNTARERFLYYPADKRLLSRFPRLVAVSSEIASELVRHGARSDRVVTLLNGIDHRRFVRDRAREVAVRASLEIGLDDIVIGAVGRLEPQKRFDLLVEAVAHLRQHGRQVVLLLVGEGSLRDSLASQISRAGLDAWCRLLGQRTDIVDLHHAFDLFVQSSDYEGTPNAVLEAMALETPIVATNAGGTAELVRDEVDGLIVPSENITALVETIDRALVDIEGRRVRAQCARRRVETTLSFDARMAALEAVYTELMRVRSGGPRAVLQAHTS